MATPWVLVPSLKSLFAEFNTLSESRDKASDGAIGDTRHGASSSDHNPDETGNTPSEDADHINEVHAIDVDRDLRVPGLTMEKCVQTIVLRHRNGLDNRLQNVIYNRRIWSRSWGWTARKYTGRNPHDQHAHFGARYTTAQENDTKGWGLRALVAPPAKAAQEDTVTEAELIAAVVKAMRNNKALSDTDVLRIGAEAAARLLPYLVRLENAAGLEAAEVPPTAEENAQAVVTAINASTVEETAALLRAVLGDRADDVGRLLAGETIEPDPTNTPAAA